MCSDCSTTSAGQPRTRRVGLSEIEAGRHCAVIGTCLSLAELKAVARKFSDYVKVGASDYETHATIVHMAGRDRKLAKVLTKLLDTKHRVMVSRFAKLESEAELAAAWTEAMAGGAVAGAFWAIITHPAAGEDFSARVYGEMHMLSHQAGAQMRSEAKVAAALEEQNRALKAELAAARTRGAEIAAGREAELATLHEQLAVMTARAERLAHAEAAAGTLDAMTHRLEALEAKLKTESHRSATLQEALRQEEGLRQKTERRFQDMLAKRPRGEDGVIGEIAPALLCGAQGEDGACDPACAKLDLCGRCILFVGGRNQHVPHLRRMVEDLNGVFAHHDGGREESLGLLPGMVGRADAVLFAVADISHAAQDELKRHCRRQERPFLPVRRSGLGAYLSALQALAQGQGQAQTA